MASICRNSKSFGSTITIPIDDLQNIIANTIHMIGNTSISSLSVLSSMSPSSQLMDSACCNHMTPNLSLFSQLEPSPHLLNIRTTNGFTMFGNNIGSISTANLLVIGVFNIPNLSYNLFSVGQLAKLDYCITFDYSRCTVQDPRRGQELRTGPKVGCMFLVDNLCLPPVASISVTAAISSIHSFALKHG